MEAQKDVEVLLLKVALLVCGFLYRGAQRWKVVETTLPSSY
jgi:hypothetical protein